jgi:putative flippase GtrA
VDRALAEQLCARFRALIAMGLPRELSRYLVIGAVCAVLNNLILICGDALGLHYAVSIMITFALVLPATYLAHAHWTFDIRLSWVGFGRFLLGSVISLLVASSTIWLFRGLLLLPMAVTAPLATVTMTAYNYIMTRWAMRRGNMA